MRVENFVRGAFAAALLLALAPALPGTAHAGLMVATSITVAPSASTFANFMAL